MSHIETFNILKHKFKYTCLYIIDNYLTAGILLNPLKIDLRPYMGKPVPPGPVGSSSRAGFS